MKTCFVPGLGILTLLVFQSVEAEPSGVGQPADIAPSAYHCQADRKADAQQRKTVKLPPFDHPPMSKVATSLTLRDGVAYWNDGRQRFVYRPCLDRRPPWVPLAVLEGLAGELSFFLRKADGARVALDSRGIAHIERKPYYFRIEYGGDDRSGVLEMLAVPNTKAILYRWKNQGDAADRFGLDVVAGARGWGVAYPLSRDEMKPFNFGRGLYTYDPQTAVFRQEYEHRPPSKFADMEPCSGLAFFSPPCAPALIHSGNKERASARPPNDQGPIKRVISTGFTFRAECQASADQESSVAYAYADTPAQLEATIALLRSRSFEQWQAHTEGYWADYLAQAQRKIERRMHCDLNRLTARERAVLDVNLIECRLLLSGNGAMNACPAAQQLIEQGGPGYYKSWIRDDSVAKLHLASIGLDDEYLAPHAELVSHNYLQQNVGGRDYRWWDTFYGYRHGATQVDSAFYGIWSLYQAWRQSGDARYVSGDRYQLMKDAVRYMKEVQDVGPITKKKVVYYDQRRKLFCEIRINEADITFDKPVWYRSPRTGKKFAFVDTFYINVLFYANYRMLAEAAAQQWLRDEQQRFLAEADELKQALNANLWRPDKGRYIAGIAYNEDGYEDIDFHSWNIGFDYIWALTLPNDEHLPFDATIKRRCLEADFQARGWAKAVFGKAEIATDLPSARPAILKEIVDDACKIDISGAGLYGFFPYVIPECENNLNLPQIFAAAPSLRALCLLAADRMGDASVKNADRNKLFEERLKKPDEGK